MAFINLKKLLIFFSLFLSYLSKENSKELSIIFNRDPIIQNVNNSEIMSNLFYNRIFINTKIASPNQNIKFYLRFNEYITYITNNYYKKEDSTSYEFIRTKKDKESLKFTPLDFKTDDLKKGYESKEVLKIEDNLLNNFYFILVDELYKSSEFYEPVIGLNLPGNDIKSVLLNTNILEQLKKNNFINKRIFSVFYFNKINKEINENNGNENGQIIFGKLPHELNDEKKYSQISKYNFNYNDLNWVNAEAGDFHKKWKLKFDSINFSNQKMSDLVAELVIEQNPFIGTTQFRQIINTFFLMNLFLKIYVK